ncbi:MAG: Trk family potassium uptake protein [Clostridiales bacterium]|nr:Trk family potassium uptake protein [Clostridiales bacterium]
MLKKLGLSSIQILTIGFALIILVGGILLSLPFATVDGKGLPFVDGLFTSASATCVTGLALYDTASVFNFRGQLIILLLIQTGGLGFMAIFASILTFRGRKLSLYSRSLVLETLGAGKFGRLDSVFFTMIRGTFLIELIGASVITYRLMAISPNIPADKAIWSGVFHSVSAFCNAGFDILGSVPGGKPGGSLVPFNWDGITLITIMLLIISGGIGFVVWNDILRYRLKWEKYPLHSKIMLSFTIMLIMVSTCFFLVCEWDHSFVKMSVPDKIVNAFFAAVTPRTAGFAATPTNNLTSAGRGLTLILMVIGAGPCSTGGGIKVTTFVVLLLSMCSEAKNYRDLEIFKRRLPDEVKARALSLTTAYIGLTIISTLIMLVIEPHFSLDEVFFECISAIGTVGLSLGITPTLSPPSKIIIISLMYAGRLGSLSVAMAIVRKKIVPAIRYPSESIVV